MKIKMVFWRKIMILKLKFRKVLAQFIKTSLSAPSTFFCKMMDDLWSFDQISPLCSKLNIYCAKIYSTYQVITPIHLKSKCLLLQLLSKNFSSATARYMYIQGLILETSHFHGISVLRISQMEEIWRNT